MKTLTYVEIDIPYCSLTYGEAPCQAKLGVTGNIKCFNTIKTCQDRNNFTDSPVTLRFAQPTDYLPKDIEAIPSIKSVSFTPAVVSLGVDLGERASLTVTFTDHPHSDTGPGFDKYLADRNYNPWEQGTFWGKFRARQPYLRGRPIRLIRGILGQSLDQMETHHFVIESFNGPTPDGVYTIVAKDVLKLADGDRAQAPVLSKGFLVSDVNKSATVITVGPAGIGDLEYPASGYIAIGGEEICAFTRSGDTFTLTRGQLGTEATDHSASDRVQLVLRYTAEDPADIIYDLMVNYAGIPKEYINLPAWKTETGTFLQRLYSAVIAEPTPVKKLIEELIEQSALSIWWDDVNQNIRLRVLRGIATDADRFTDDEIIENSFKIKEQPNKRVSQVWTYFGQRNPLRPVDEENNYRSTALTVDLEAETNYGTPSIKKIFSRWIPFGGRSVALRVNDLQIGRYRDPPRRFNFSLFRPNTNISLGTGYRIESWVIQDETGARSNAPVQVTRLNPLPDRYEVEAEEMLFKIFSPDDLINRVITIDNNINAINLRQMHDSIYPAPTGEEDPEISITFIIESGVIVGSTGLTVPACDVGEWPEGVVPTLIVKGRIQGAGGRGDGYSPRGTAGGTALYTRHAINLDVSEGMIYGGGGGGGRGKGSENYYGGGGGAGIPPGEGGRGAFGGGNGAPGTLNEGGAGISRSGRRRGGNGGAPGMPGQNGGNTNGFPPGAAIDGVSFVTIIQSGDIRGLQIN